MTGRQTRPPNEPPPGSDPLSLDSQLCFAVYASAHAFDAPTGRCSPGTT